MFIPKYVIAIALIIGITMYLNAYHEDNPQWQKVKDWTGVAFIGALGVFFVGFYVGIELTKKLELSTNSLRGTLLVMTLGFGYLACLFSIISALGLLQ